MWYYDIGQSCREQKTLSGLIEQINWGDKLASYHIKKHKKKGGNSP